jgi:hypothetical protein
MLVSVAVVSPFVASEGLSELSASPQVIQFSIHSPGNCLALRPVAPLFRATGGKGDRAGHSGRLQVASHPPTSSFRGDLPARDRES